MFSLFLVTQNNYLRYLAFVKERMGVAASQIVILALLEAAVSGSHNFLVCVIDGIHLILCSLAAPDKPNLRTKAMA